MNASLFAMEYSISVFKIQPFDILRVAHKNGSCQNLCKLDTEQKYFGVETMQYQMDI